MDTAERIIEYYISCESMDDTAKTFGLSHQKVRKILITAGVYSSPETNMAISLLEKGLKVEEIAKRMGVTKKTVSSYLPYSKCMYNMDNPTENALRIRKCRDKKAKR